MCQYDRLYVGWSGKPGYIPVPFSHRKNRNLFEHSHGDLMNLKEQFHEWMIVNCPEARIGLNPFEGKGKMFFTDATQAVLFKLTWDVS
jgi:hypothetical protein